MPNLEIDDSKDLKAKIDGLSHQACKQILFGMVDLLLFHPSILTKIFRMFIEDGFNILMTKEGGDDDG